MEPYHHSDMVVSEIGAPNTDPKISESFLLGPPRKVPLILGSSHIGKVYLHYIMIYHHIP